jgi:F1F0 ATPase subunit 2
MELLVYAATGAGLGIVYFYALYRTVLLLPQASISRIMPLYLLRIGAALTVFWHIAAQGALPVLLALAGFFTARLVVQGSIGTRRRWKRVRS